MSKIIPDVKFIFFSDDIDYVQRKLIPLLGAINYKIVFENKNTVKNGGGYKDFYLISLCQNQICSLGSFGIESAKINKNPDKIVITTKNISGNIKNLLILDSDGKLLKSTMEGIF